MCCTRDLVAGMATCGTRRGSAGGPVVHDKPAFLVTTTHDGVSDPTGVCTDLYRHTQRPVVLSHYYSIIDTSSSLSIVSDWAWIATHCFIDTAPFLTCMYNACLATQLKSQVDHCWAAVKEEVETV